jgi:AcrR family transcriptional regulator
VDLSQSDAPAEPDSETEALLGGERVPAPASSREKILDVAEALFARRGYAGVGLREVAGQVGLGKSSLFHHFRSKADLYISVLMRVFERIDERVGPATSGAGSPAERLERGVDALVDVLAEHPTTARLLLRGLFEDDDLPEEAGPALAEAEGVLERIVGRVLALVSEGAASGAFRSAAPGHVLQTLIGAVVYHFASGEFGETVIGAPLFSAGAVRRRKEEVKQLLFRGLLAPPAPALPQGGQP